MGDHSKAPVYGRAFVLMAAANLFTVSSFGSFFLFPLFVADRGGSKADIGIIMGVFALSSVLVRPWISEMIDRIGRKRSYTLGTLIMTGAPLVYMSFQGPLEQFYGPLILLRLAHGVGLAVCFTAVFTYIADIVPASRLNEGIGMFGVTGLSGLAVGPVVGELIIEALGFTSFFGAAAAMAALGLCLHLPLPESYQRDSSLPAISFFSVLMGKKALLVAVLAFLFGFALAASGSFVSPFAEDNGIAFVSLYFLSYSSAAVFTRLLGGRLADRVGEERIIPYALLITGSGLLILMLPAGLTLLLASGLLSGCGHGFLFPCLNSLAVRNELSHNRGKITGVFTGGIDAGAFSGATALGYVGEWAGFQGLFFTAGTALFLGFIIYRALIGKLGPGD